MYDIVLSHGNIITFNEDHFNEDNLLHDFNIGIIHDKIAAISKDEMHGQCEIDVTGKYVSPGFIDFHSHVNGRRFSAECMLRQGVTTTIGGERNFDAGIIREIEEKGFLLNHGFYISYSFTLRRAVGLINPSENASKDQIDRMIKLVERFFQFGVMGIHIGLEYAPGTFEDELAEILKIAKQYNKVAVIHLRKDGYAAIESLNEIIRVVRKTNASVNLLHTMYTAGYDKLLDKFLSIISEARAEGYNITADTGVYAAYPTFAGSLSLDEGWIGDFKQGISEKNLLISSGIHVGKFCDKELFQYIRKNFPTTLITAFIYDEEQIDKAIAPDYMMISTNGAYGPHLKGIGHPEGAGTFPKYLSKYVRDKKILPLAKAVKKITWLPAKRFGIENKGNIKPQMDADLTIFDFGQLESMSDYVNVGDPNKPPKGIDLVIINGKIILKDGIISEDCQNCGKLITSKTNG